MAGSQRDESGPAIAAPELGCNVDLKCLILGPFLRLRPGAGGTAGGNSVPVYSEAPRPRHRSCPPLFACLGALPFAAMSATRLVRLPTSVTISVESPASVRVLSGITARLKPSLAASLSLAAHCATGRTAPDSETSPK